MYVCMHACTCVCVCVYVCMHMCVCMYIYIYMCMHMCVCVCVCMYVFFLIRLFSGMSHYICNITCFVLHYTQFRFLWFPSFGRILRIQFFFCSFISLWLSFLFRLEPLCLHKTSELMEFTNFWNSFVYLFTSSLLDVCMYICMYAHVCVCVCVCMYVCTYVCM